MQQSLKDTDLKKTLFLEDGFELEGYGNGGIVEIVKTDKIQWKRDIIPFFMATGLMAVIHLSYYFTGNLAIIYFLFQAFILKAYLLDQEAQTDKQNVSRASERDFLNDKRFYIPLYTCLAAGTFTWIWSLCLMSEDVKFQSYYFTKMKPQTWPQWIIFHYIFGFISAMETQCGHELIHRREYYNKFLGMVAHSKIFYTHFKDEHVQGHHKTLATPEDPSTSRLSESFYAYVPREIFGTHYDQLQREIQRIKRQHGRDCPLTFLIVFNKMTIYFIIHVTICVTIYLLLGWASLKHQFWHAAVGLTYQCFANYITHYGLLRNKDKNGIYDSINKYHSWNFVSSPALFRLPRHSDHHMCSFRPYQILRRFDDAPWNPFQFMICVYVALVPPLWFWAMNPRAQAVRDFCQGKANTFVSFNNIQKSTPRDKLTLRVVWSYFAFTTAVLGYLSFFSNMTCVLENDPIAKITV